MRGPTWASVEGGADSSDKRRVAEDGSRGQSIGMLAAYAAPGADTGYLVTM